MLQIEIQIEGAFAKVNWRGALMNMVLATQVVKFHRNLTATLLLICSHSEARHFLCDDCGRQFKRKGRLSSPPRVR